MKYLCTLPQYANLLISGHKTVEFQYDWNQNNADININDMLYVKNTDGEVIGHVIVANIERLAINELWRKYAIESMMPWGDFKSYYENHEYGIAITVSRPTKLTNEKTIDELNQKSLSVIINNDQLFDNCDECNEMRSLYNNNLYKYIENKTGAKSNIRSMALRMSYYMINPIKESQKECLTKRLIQYYSKSDNNWLIH